MTETKRADSGTGTPEAETVGSEPERSPTIGMTPSRLKELENLAHSYPTDFWEQDIPELAEALCEIKRLRDENERLNDVVSAAWSWLEWRISWGGIPGRSPVEAKLLSALTALEKDDPA